MLPTHADADEAAHSLAGPSAVADTISVLCVLSIALLHARRFFACRGSAHVRNDAVLLWDWMCATDPFASWSFLPLHVLAVACVISWPLLFVGRKPSARSIEVFLASWAMCWFSPTHPFAATANCVDADERCQHWAESGECTRNKDFMLKTCRKACGDCVGDGSDGSFARLGPRAVSCGASGALLALAGARLVLSSMSDASQQRVGVAAHLAVRPLAACAAIVMRTPLAPLLRLVIRLLRRALGAVAAMLRCAVRVLTGCANLLRRRLIVMLGGAVDQGATGGGIDGLFDGEEVVQRKGM